MPAAVTQQDRVHLRRALELAEGGRGRVSPNPLVGAVLVRDGEVDRRGLPRRARRSACRGGGVGGLPGPRSRRRPGPRCYVTLEPCAHQGRQPPCTDAILAAGVARVVIASEDPSEKASGRGPGILRDEGIEVELANGAEAAAARLLNQPFRKHSRTGRPLVVLKSALTPRRPGGDGRRRLAVDLRRGEPRAGSPLAGGVRRRRASGSARRSPTTRCSPRAATARATPTRQPHPGRLRLRGAAAAGLAAGRLDRRGAAARDRRAGRAGRARIEALERRAPRWSSATGTRRPAWRRRSRSWGAARSPPAARGRPDPGRGSFLDAGEIDELRLFIAPIVLGGAGARPLVGGEGARLIAGRDAGAVDGLGALRRATCWSARG